MARMTAAEHLRQLESEIWAGSDQEEDRIDSMRPHPVVEAVKSIKEHHAKLAEAAQGMSATQQAIAEGMAGVLADVVGIIKDSHTGLMQATEMSAAHAVAKEMAAIKETMAADAKRHQQALGAMTITMERMAKQLNEMTAALTAPRHLIVDEDGTPVGVRIGS